MWRSLGLSAMIMTLTVASITVSTHAAFTASATVSGIHFATGNAALKLFGNLAYTNAGNNGNLTPILPGVGFNGIGPNWTSDYVLKYFNTGSVNLKTSLRAEVQSDPGGLAEHVMVETWLWGDSNNNGSYNDGDALSLLGEAQSLASLVSNPVDLGQLNVSQPRGLLLRFTTGDLPSTTQNQEAKFTFIIDGTTANTDHE